MLRYLIVGVGGSGGNTVRYTARELERRLSARGWTGGLPKAWQFLHIDVREQPDDIKADLPASLASAAGHLGLAKYPHAYSHYDDKLVDNHYALSAIAGWRPDPTAGYNPPYQGAGQRRVVGRVVTVTELSRVAERLDAALMAMNGGDAAEELTGLAAHLHAPPVPQAGLPARVIVVTSLGGGAGSGAFLDVLQLLRGRANQGAQWLAEPIALCYATDIFDGLPKQLRTGVEPNTLGALSEMLSAYYHEGPLGQAESALLQAGGGGLPLSGNVGPTYTLVVGRSNGAISFTDSTDVYQSAAKALATFIGNPTVQTQFDTYLAAGWAGPPTTSNLYAAGGANPTSSFGYSNVSLGRDLFAKYSAERLAAGTLRRLREGHLERASSTSATSVEALLRQRADDRQDGFFAKSGLWEVTRDHNDVLDALRDADEKRKRLDDLREKMRKSLDQRVLKADEWQASFAKDFDEAAAKYALEEHTDRVQRARKWVADIQPRVVDAVVEAVSNDGIPVTLELLQRLDTQLRAAIVELREAETQFRLDEEPRFLRLAAAVFEGIKGRLRENHQVFDRAAEARRTALSRRTEADLYALAAELLADLIERFLPSLRLSISEMAAGIAAELSNADVRQTTNQWVTYGVAAHLQPAPNETLLEDVDKFPEQFEQMMSQTFNGLPADDAFSAAIAEVISGAWASNLEPGDLPHQTLLNQTAKWYPRNSAARPENVGANSSVFRGQLSVTDLPSRAESWVRQRIGDFSSHVAENLQSWLDPGQAGAADRAQRFVNAFDTALRRAAPMVSVNPDVLYDMHGMTSVGFVPIMNGIPIGPGHAAYQPISNLLQQAGVPAGNAAAAFDAAAASAEVEIVTFLGAPVHPVVFDSLVGPIAAEWAQARIRPTTQNAFWRFRRSRPLTSFTPVSPEVQRCIVRGWISAGLLGYLGQLSGRWSAAPLSVWSPEGPYQFPDFLFEDVSLQSEVLPALFEALPLGLVAFGTGDSRAVHAYERLVALGSPGGAQPGPYTRLNPELADWISTGKMLSDAPQPPPASGTALQSAEERRAAITKQLDALEVSVGQLLAAPVSVATTLTLDGRWELRHVLSGATTDLKRAIGAIVAQSDGGGVLA